MQFRSGSHSRKKSENESRNVLAQKQLRIEKKLNDPYQTMNI